MRISGLSNQWKTRDGLLDGVKSNLIPVVEGKWRKQDELHNERVHTIMRLLLQLESIEGPDIWIGSSLLSYNINLRDTTHAHDWVTPVVYVEAYVINPDPPRCGYRFRFNLTGSTKHFMEHEAADLDEACAVIVRLLKSQQAQLPL
jgi:hypothetical protein